MDWKAGNVRWNVKWNVRWITSEQLWNVRWIWSEQLRILFLIYLTFPACQSHDFIIIPKTNLEYSSHYWLHKTLQDKFRKQRIPFENWANNINLMLSQHIMLLRTKLIRSNVLCHLHFSHLNWSQRKQATDTWKRIKMPLLHLLSPLLFHHSSLMMKMIYFQLLMLLQNSKTWKTCIWKEFQVVRWNLWGKCNPCGT